MFSGWRTRLHYWTRQRRALKKAAVYIGAFGFLSAWIFVVLFPEPPGVSLDPAAQQVSNEARKLHAEKSPQPRRLSRWLRGVTIALPHLVDKVGGEYPTWAAYQKDGRLLDQDVRALIQQHAGNEETKHLFEDFLQAQLLREQAPGPAAAARMHQRAESAAPPPMANELEAAILLRKEDEYGAMKALFREATLFADAVKTREEVLRLALNLKDTESVRTIVSMPGWLAKMPVLLQHQASMQLQDPWLQGHTLFQLWISDTPLLPLILTVFVSFLWYVILVLHSEHRKWRWLLPILPIMAGIVSIWPTFTFMAWQELKWNMTEAAPFPLDLWYFIAGVGLREETAKLLLFSLFLPWLLWRRQPGLALLTGAFVGLGFALEENLQYYQEHGLAVAVTRFLTANFFHAASTGIAGHALYVMLRSRFAHAEKFIASFLGVVVVHGLYDFLPSLSEWSYVSMVLLALLAWHFLDLMEQETPASRQIISPAAILLLGTAVLMALIFWMSAVTQNSVGALADAAGECVSILPVAVIYWRRF